MGRVWAEIYMPGSLAFDVEAQHGLWNEFDERYGDFRQQSLPARGSPLPFTHADTEGIVTSRRSTLWHLSKELR
jgi:hypothetical protein